MLIPKYWAQYKQRFDSKTESNESSKQATIKRYGWSDVSQVEALNHAKTRVSETHKRWLAGEDIVRRERREEYNASNGIPIREEIISEHCFPQNESSNSSAAATRLIVTRNSYGAQVANLDNIAIIDVDNDQLLHYKYPERYNYYGFMPSFPVEESTPLIKVKVWSFIFLFIFIASVIAWLGLSWLWLLVIMVGATVYLWQQASKKEKARAQKYADDISSLLPFITDLMQQRVATHPKESFRLYVTPAGFRIIATHDTAAPNDDLVAQWFEYFHADVNYVRLCQAQQCFRARLTAKPWRMAEVENNDLAKDIPAKEFWFATDGAQFSEGYEPSQADITARNQWITGYDNYAKSYQACRYIESFFGRESNKVVVDSKSIQVAINEFVQWHDEACQVGESLPLA